MRDLHIEHAPDGIQVMWATPMSGYGHVADEQALPRIMEKGVDLTPAMGGEPSHCPSNIVGLPCGWLGQAWPWRQRMFNAPRRSINRYWREAFISRCRLDGQFQFWEQLDFATVFGGFEGVSPVLKFRREFGLGHRQLTVDDRLEFRAALHFSSFALLNLPLFGDWTLQTPSKRWVKVETDQQGTWVRTPFSSSSGHGVLWCHQNSSIGFVRGQVIKSRCTYHF